MKRGSHVSHISRRPRYYAFYRVKHACEHWELHAFSTRTEAEHEAIPAQLEALAGQVCKACQKEQGQ